MCPGPDARASGVELVLLGALERARLAEAARALVLGVDHAADFALDDVGARGVSHGLLADLDPVLGHHVALLVGLGWNVASDECIGEKVHWVVKRSKTLKEIKIKSLNVQLLKKVE